MIAVTFAVRRSPMRRRPVRPAIPKTTDQPSVGARLEDVEPGFQPSGFGLKISAHLAFRLVGSVAYRLRVIHRHDSSSAPMDGTRTRTWIKNRRHIGQRFLAETLSGGYLDKWSQTDRARFRAVSFR
jgi:hypothetical protein